MTILLYLAAESQRKGGIGRAEELAFATTL